jgi:branched-chain amino acid transport system ATP-binding protein/branched-chain amino acid transport system permease protein
VKVRDGASVQVEGGRALKPERPALELSFPGESALTGAPRSLWQMINEATSAPLVFAVVAVALLMVPVVLKNVVYGSDLRGQIRAANMVALLYGALIFAIAALGVALLTGYTGLLSLGHAGFLAIGDLTMTSLARAGLNPWLALLLTIVVSAAAGALLALPAASMRGFSFTAMSLVFLPSGVAVGAIVDAFARPGRNRQMRRLVSDQSSAFGYSVATRVGDRAAFYLVVLTCFVVVVIATTSLMRSRWGRAFQAIRESEHGARASGIPVGRYKFCAVIISAVPVAIAGALYAQDPRVSGAGGGATLADPTLSLLLVAVNVVGGLGTVAGPLVGVALLVLLPDLALGTTASQSLSPLLSAGGTMLAVFAAPGGVVGALALLRSRREAHLRRVMPSILSHLEARAAEVSVDGTRAGERLARWRRAEPVPDRLPVRHRARERWEGQAAEGRVAEGEIASSLVVSRLSKRYGGVIALNGVDLSIPRGVISGLIGPNGSGKTTLLNCVSGFDRVDSGIVVVGDQDLTNAPAHRRAEVGVGRTFQSPRVWRRLTVLDNVRAGAHACLHSGFWSSLLHVPAMREEEAELVDRAWEILSVLGLGARGRALAGTLAFAEQRRLEVGRALAGRPELLLLDEPAAGMTPTEAGGLAEILDELREGGITMLIVEHRLDLIVRVAEKVTVLDHGEVLFEGRPEDVANDPGVQRAYLGI